MCGKNEINYACILKIKLIFSLKSTTTLFEIELINLYFIINKNFQIFYETLTNKEGIINISLILLVYKLSLENANL